MNSEWSTNHLEMGVCRINQPEMKLSPGQRWCKYIVENKSLCHRRGSHSLFVLPTSWTESLWSNCRVINMMLLWWAAVTLTSISKCCIWFCASCFLCTANTQTQTAVLSKHTEQTGRAVVRTREWDLFMLQEHREQGRGQGLFSPSVEMNASQWRWMGQET